MFSPRTKFLFFLLPALLLLVASRPVEAQAVNFGTVAIGQTGTAQSVTLTFTGGGSVTSQLALTSGAQNKDFAITSGGSCTTGQSYAAGGTCTVSATFSPLYAGLRMGAVVLKDSSGNVPCKHLRLWRRLRPTGWLSLRVRSSGGLSLPRHHSR
jgi:hypothetical protein